MKIRRWIAVAIVAIAVALLLSMVELESHILSRLLQMSLMDEYILTGISVFLVMLGIVLGILYFAKQNRK